MRTQEPGDAAAPAAPEGSGTAFGTALRRHRRAAGLTQAALAARAGVGLRTLQGLERGEAHPLPATARRLADGLGLPAAARAPFLAAAAPPPRVARAPGPVRGGLRLVPPPARGRPPARPGNLPAALTSFVGRTAELAAVAGLLAAQRLVTLTGPPGVGKTRLALEVARATGGAFPDGVGVVPLAALADPAVVPAAAAQALGVRETADGPPLRALCAALRGARLLLILDNCEHVVDAAARLTEALLGAGPGVTILATSRAALGLAGEVPWRVPPLALPPDPGAAAPLAAAAAADHDAVRLFAARAQTVEPAFAVTERNAAAVARLCRRLDGLPLALELAAARVRVLTVDELLRRLDDRFRLLTGGGRTAPPRHQTLQATVAWSYDLLAAADRRLFARLGVFAGGFTLEAAERVGAGAGLAAADVLEALTRLVDQSLVQPEPGPDGVGRYHLLEALRAFAFERLAARGEAAAAHARHLAYVTALAERTAPELLAGAPALDSLEREHDNCRAALGWALRHPDPATTALALRLAGALVEFWRIRAHHREGHDWLERLLALPGAAAPTAARAQALVGAGSLAIYLGDWARVRGRAEEGLALARALGDQRLVMLGLFFLALPARATGDDAAAAALLAESLAVARRLDDRRAAAARLFHLGWHALIQGDYATARGHLEESLDLCRRAGERPAQIASVLNRLGDVRRAAGDLPAARTLHADALAVWRDVGYPRGIADALCGLAEAAVAAGDGAATRACYDEALAAARQPGGGQFPVRGFQSLALAACALGEAGAAREHAQRAVAVWRDPARRGHHDYKVAALLEAFAALAAARAQPARALRLVGAADALRAACGRPRYPLQHAYLDRDVAPARRALAAGAAAALSAGGALTLDQALAEAVDWAPAAAGPATPAAEPAGSAGPRTRPREPAGQPPTGGDVPASGRLRVDAQTYEVWRGEERLAPSLSPLEFGLVAYLYAHRERVCTRRELGDALWGAHAWDPPMLHNLVRRVKTKLEPAPGRPRYLHSRRGVGYHLTA